MKYHLFLRDKGNDYIGLSIEEFINEFLKMVKNEKV
jgi:hypothetical protein